MVSIFNFNFLLGRIDVWIDGWTHTYTATAAYSCTGAYTHTRTYAHTNALIYRRINKRRMCKYINPSIYPQTSRTPNQSPANASATRQRHINSRQNNVWLSTLQIKENSAQIQVQAMTLTSTRPIHLRANLPLFFLLFMYALTHSWGIDATVGM